MKNGFSLLEVMIFTALFSVFFITVIGITAASLRNMKQNEERIRATHLGSEVIEWVRGEKEANWSLFNTTYASAAGRVWCFDTSPIVAWPGAAGSCSSSSLHGIYRREVTLASDSLTGQVRALATISWTTGPQTYQIPINTIFTSPE